MGAKNKIKLFLVFLLGIVMTLGGFSSVNAGTLYEERPYIADHPPYYGALFSPMWMDGNLVYCIQSRRESINGASDYYRQDLAEYLRTQGLDWNTSEAVANELGIIAGFGYGYAGDTSNEMMWATQIRVWQTL